MARIAEGIEERGSGLRIHFSWKGRRYKETLAGPVTAALIKRAIKRREWLLSRLQVGLPIEEQSGKLLRNAATDWFDSLDVKRSTLMSYQALYRSHWQAWESLAVDSITPGMIKSLINQKDISSKTKRNALIVLSGILRHADVNPNPCANIRFRKQQKKPIERYRPAELEAVMKFLDGESLVYFSLLRATGLRPGEALALEWSDYDGERLDISKQIVRRRIQSDTKTSVRRRVYVPGWVRPLIDNHSTRFKQSFIFLNSIGTFHCDTDVFNKAWRKAHNRARVPYRIPYCLRHTRAAELLSQNASPALAARELGHSVQMFLNVYSEFIEEYSTEDLGVLEGVGPGARGERVG